MNNLTIFVIAIIGLFIVVLSALIVPYLIRIFIGNNPANLRRQINKLIIKDQLQELETEKNQHLIVADEYYKSKEEIEERAIEDIRDDVFSQLDFKKSSIAINVLVVSTVLVTASTFMYLYFGTPSAINENFISNAETNSEKHNEQMGALLVSLEKKLESNPNNLEGWLLLAKSYKSINKMDLAVSAYAKARNLYPQIFNSDSQLLADYADAVASVNGTFTGEADKLIDLALQANEQNIMALWLAGSSKMNVGQYRGAMEYWLRIRSLLPIESEERKVIQEAIDATALKAQLPPNPDDKKVEIETAKNNIASVDSQGQLSTSKSKDVENPHKNLNTNIEKNEDKNQNPATLSNKILISGEVLLDNNLSAKKIDSDNLIVIVRPLNQRMPVATIIIPNPVFPQKFAISDINSMVASEPLSGLDEVTIEARLSSQQIASPQSGDLISSVNKINIGNKNLTININQIRP